MPFILSDTPSTLPQTMTNEEIRIKVAEAMGLFRIEPLRRTTRKRNDDPNGVRLWYCSEHHGGAATYSEVPNYPEDLNACHEMEKSLVTVGEWISYMENLASVATIPTNGATAWELVCKMSHSDQKGVLYGLAGFVHATARQRCLAYLKVKGILP